MKKINTVRFGELEIDESKIEEFRKEKAEKIAEAAAKQNL